MKRAFPIAFFALLFSAPVSRAAAATATHAHKPVARSEHVASMDLVRVLEASSTASHSGLWSALATWRAGRIPAADAVVFIPPGLQSRCKATRQPCAQ